jgi:hypothetical protein
VVEEQQQQQQQQGNQEGQYCASSWKRSWRTALRVTRTEQWVKGGTDGDSD